MGRKKQRSEAGDADLPFVDQDVDSNEKVGSEKKDVMDSDEVVSSAINPKADESQTEQIAEDAPLARRTRSRTGTKKKQETPVSELRRGRSRSSKKSKTQASNENAEDSELGDVSSGLPKEDDALATGQVSSPAASTDTKRGRGRSRGKNKLLAKEEQQQEGETTREDITADSGTADSSSRPSTEGVRFKVEEDGTGKGKSVNSGPYSASSSHTTKEDTSASVPPSEPDRSVGSELPVVVEDKGTGKGNDVDCGPCTASSSTAMTEDNEATVPASEPDASTAGKKRSRSTSAGRKKPPAEGEDEAAGNRTAQDNGLGSASFSSLSKDNATAAETLSNAATSPEKGTTRSCSTGGNKVCVEGEDGASVKLNAEYGGAGIMSTDPPTKESTAVIVPDTETSLEPAPSAEKKTTRSSSTGESKVCVKGEDGAIVKGKAEDCNQSATPSSPPTMGDNAATVTPSERIVLDSKGRKEILCVEGVDQATVKGKAEDSKPRASSSNPPTMDNIAATVTPSAHVVSTEKRRTKGSSTGANKPSVNREDEATGKQNASEEKAGKNMVGSDEDEKGAIRDSNETKETGTKDERKQLCGRKGSEEAVETDDPMDIDTTPTKRTPTLDVVVHRIRHLNFLPKSIVCIRGAPKQSKYSGLLAVSRDNGSVELRSANEKFRTLGTVGGQTSKTVNAMAWVMASRGTLNGEPDNIPQLVGASQDGSLFVVNFCSSRVECVTPSGGGGVFALQSLYETGSGDVGHDSSLVAAGCEDGSIRIFQYSTDQSLTLVSTVPTTGAAVLSLAWRRMENIDSSGDFLSGVYIFAGVADGTIRTYTYQSGRTKGTSWKSGHRMTVETLGRRTPTRIWSLKLLKDWTVVSSDSLGHVQFWDGTTGSLEQTFNQTDQKSDVLDLAVSGDECKVFASGVDSRVVCIERPEQSPDDVDSNKSRRWILTHAQRPHTHDVKALAVCFQDRGDGGAPWEVLCSGGIDMKLGTYSIALFRTKRPRVIYPWPAQTPIIVAPKARFIAILKDTRSEVHQLGEYEPDADLVPVAEDKTLIGTVEIQAQSNLTCGAISEDGHLMLLCDSYSVNLFKLNHGKSDFDPVPVKIFDQPKASVSSALFVGNDTILLATSNASLVVLDVESEGATKKQTISPHAVGARDFADRLPVHAMVSTSSGKCLATICNTYGGSIVDIYVRDEDKTYRHWWSLPSLHSTVTAVSFVNKSESRLAVACVNFELYVFDVRLRELDPWSSQSGKSVTGPVPTELSTRNDYPLRICTHHHFQEKILLGAFGAFLVVDLSKSPPNRCRTVPESHVRRKKRQRTLSSTQEPDADQGVEAIQCLRYNSMLFMGFAANSEMIVVEQPWLNVVATLPDALQRKIYGAG